MMWYLLNGNIITLKTWRCFSCTLFSNRPFLCSHRHHQFAVKKTLSAPQGKAGVWIYFYSARHLSFSTIIPHSMWERKERTTMCAPLLLQWALRQRATSTHTGLSRKKIPPLPVPTGSSRSRQRLWWRLRRCSPALERSMWRRKKKGEEEEGEFFLLPLWPWKTQFSSPASHFLSPAIFLSLYTTGMWKNMKKKGKCNNFPPPSFEDVTKPKNHVRISFTKVVFVVR